MARNTAFIILTSMTTVAVGRIKLAFDLVHGHEVAAVWHLTVWPITVKD